MPGNAEIGMMILLSTGKQSAAVMASWIPAAMLALSIYLLAMAISKRNRLASITACLIVLSIPMIIWQIFSAYADLLATAGILAAFALILGANYGGQEAKPAGLPPALCFISALACGISLGTKAIYYFYAVMFSGFIAWVLWVNHKRGKKVLVKLALSAVLGMLLPSSFWFARAWKQTGSPVYPLQVRLGQRVIFAGYQPAQLGNYGEFETTFVRQKLEWLVYPWREWRRDPGYLKIPYGEGEGVGAVFATFIPLGLMFFFLRAWVPGTEHRRDWALLLCFAALLISWWGLMARVPRYGQPILIFACVLSVPLIMMLQIRKRRAFAALLLSSMIATSVVSASAPLHVVAGRFRKHLWSRSQIYSYPKLIDELPDGSFVLDASGIEEKNFPLAGKRLTNRVIANFEAPTKLTAQSLRASGAEYVVEVVPGGKYSEASLASSGATVVDDELVPSGNDQLHWRVWKVSKPTSAPPHPSNSANGGAAPE
jgi:hypothetical protein